jgi:hypothetical protein
MLEIRVVGMIDSVGEILEIDKSSVAFNTFCVQSVCSAANLSEFALAMACVPPLAALIRHYRLLTATLTFPTESLAAYTAAGYIVKPVNTAFPTKHDSGAGSSPTSSTAKNSGSSSNNANKIPSYFDRNKPTSSVGAFPPLLTPSSSTEIVTLDPSTSGLPPFGDPSNKDNSGSGGQQFVVVDAATAEKPDIIIFILGISISILTTELVQFFIFHTTFT